MGRGGHTRCAQLAILASGVIAIISMIMIPSSIAIIGTLAAFIAALAGVYGLSTEKRGTKLK